MKGRHMIFVPQGGDLSTMGFHVTDVNKPLESLTGVVVAYHTVFVNSLEHRLNMSKGDGPACVANMRCGALIAGEYRIQWRVIHINCDIIFQGRVERIQRMHVYKHR